MNTNWKAVQETALANPLNEPAFPRAEGRAQLPGGLLATVLISLNH